MLPEVEHIGGLATLPRRHQHYFHLLRQGRWLLCWCIVQCTTVELKDWIKWPDPTLPGGSTLQRKEIIASQLSSFRGPHCDIAPCANRSQNAFPQCKAALPPWDSCHGGRGIQESTRHASPICWICPMWKKNGKREITFRGKESHHPRKCTSVWDNLAFKIDASLLLFGFLCLCRCHRHGSFKYFTAVQLSHPHQWFNDIDSLRQSKHHVVAPTCRGCSSWYARLVFLAD